jgi:hypothetical protein
LEENVYGVCVSNHPLVVDGLWKDTGTPQYHQNLGKDLNFRDAAEEASRLLREYAVVTVHDHRNPIYPTIMADKNGVVFPACKSTDAHWSEYQYIKEELEKTVKAL